MSEPPRSTGDNGDIRIAARIVEIRLDHGMTMDQFAAALGVSQPTQSRVERAKRMPDAGYLLALRKTFKVDINQLLEGSQMARGSSRAVHVQGNGNVVVGRDVVGGTVTVAKGRRKT